ncbi:MAG TPA: NUDIX domain-containing protein [Thermoleophilaceae bacterium]|nr:NUDIX domain-containing protein [Thermoleophilaceae bacterium]
MTAARRGRRRSEPAGPRYPTGNPRVRFVEAEVLSADWYVLRKLTFDYARRDGSWSRESRETYDRGNGATILLYDESRGTVLLTRQFRCPAYVNGHRDGMLIEAAAGLLDGQDAEAAIRREAEEETGVRVGSVTKLFELFMSPGSVTERLAFYVGPYDAARRVSGGGGVVGEGEDIEVLELSLDDALARVESGEIVDAKTVLLLQWADRNAPGRPC